MIINYSDQTIIKNKKSAEKFIDALENAENKKAKKVKINKMVQDVTDCEQIRKIFNQK